MTVSFYWEFPQLDVVYNEGEFSNVVQAVHWKYFAKEDNYVTNLFGCTPLDFPTGVFVNYSDLTPQIVSGWVSSKMGAEEISRLQNQLITNIESMKTPKSGAMTPPWQTTEPV